MFGTMIGSCLLGLSLCTIRAVDSLWSGESMERGRWRYGVLDTDNDVDFVFPAVDE